VQVEALTPGLRVDCDYRDDRQRNLLAGFVRALRNAFEGLKKFYESPSRPIPDPCGYRSNERAAIDRPFPYKDSYTNDQGSKCAFEYKLRLMQGALIFLAEHTEPEANAKPILVKFTRTYSEVVHKLLASNGFAPELFAVEDLAGGWKMVVMEYLSGWVMLGVKPHHERLKYKERLKRALSIIHDRGLVHGDVRGPNILVSKDDVKLVDFDHCGEEGVKRYPREWDHRQRLDDAKEGDLMQKTHDDRMLERIFDYSASSPGRGFYRYYTPDN
jgi:serine/threonine protein kinase